MSIYQINSILTVARAEYRIYCRGESRVPKFTSKRKAKKWIGRNYPKYAQTAMILDYETN